MNTKFIGGQAIYKGPDPSFGDLGWVQLELYDAEPDPEMGTILGNFLKIKMFIPIQTEKFTSMPSGTWKLNASADETSREGLGYESYLQILLWTVSEEKITMRAMNLIEKNLDVRMDNMVSRMTCSYEYEAVPLFWSFVQIGNGRLTSYYFSNQAQILFGL